MSRIHIILIILGILTILLANAFLLNTADAQDRAPAAKFRLVSLWTSGDPEVAEKVCFMYTHAAQKYKWFEEVNLIVWGPSALLLSNNLGLQNQIKAMIKDGVKVEACKACADSYGVSQILTSLGIEVKYMGAPMTNMIKEGRKFLTF
jgi:hypothetical protein